MWSEGVKWGVSTLLYSTLLLLATTAAASVGSNSSRGGGISPIPSQWEKCRLNRCKNGGLCFQDGTAEFCV